MKAILEFDLDNHDDVMAHKRCIKAVDMAIVLFEFLHNSKRKIQIELDNKNLGATPKDVLAICFAEFLDLLDNNNINIDEIIE